MWLCLKPAVLLQAMIIYVQHTRVNTQAHTAIFHRRLAEKLSSHWIKCTKRNMLLKEINKCCEIMQSHRDYSVKKVLGSLTAVH